VQTETASANSSLRNRGVRASPRRAIGNKHEDIGDVALRCVAIA